MSQPRRRIGAIRLVPRWIPRTSQLPDGDWRARHRLVCTALAVHVPIVFGYAIGTGRAAWEAGLLTAPVVLLLTLAAVAARRRSRAVAATAGLLVTSAVLVQLSGGAPAMHLHYFVAVALCAIYEDWAPYAVALSAVVVAHAVIGVLAPHTEYDAATPHPLQTAATHAAFLTAVGLTQLAFWHYAERSRAAELRYRQELYDGQSSLRAELRRITTTREDLLATVSHEFRTPLTAIRGAALTLRRHHDRLQSGKVDELLDAVISNTDRLGRLLENMLTAAEVREPDRTAVTDVREVADEVATLVHGAHAQRIPHIAVALDGPLTAVVERSALHQILANLLDNAILHAAPGSQAIVSGAIEGDEVVVTVANEAHGLDARTLAGLFEPFTQGDASVTRPKQGAGVGLYVVRRLVEVSAGSLTVYSQPGWVSVELRLPAAQPAGTDPGAPAARAYAAELDHRPVRQELAQPG